MHAANRTKSRGTIFYAGGPSKSLKIGPGGPHKMGDQIFYDKPHGPHGVPCDVAPEFGVTTFQQLKGGVLGGQLDGP